jgi:hypothetical protein
MSDKVRIISLFILLVLSGGAAAAILWLSPNPIPLGNAELLAACLAMFSASGVALVRMLTGGGGTDKKDSPKKDRSKRDREPQST